MKNFPQGFQACGIHAGIGKLKSKPDLGIFFSREICSAAAVFTANRVKAAPVLLSREAVRSGRARAIVVNSGCANACTGKRGLSDAEAMVETTSAALDLKSGEVLVASTGVIGKFLPIQAVKSGIKHLAAQVHRGGSDPLKAVHAMMTTDRVPKFDSREVRRGGQSYRIWGCVKGAGMIHPNMATMLSFILTDARVAGAQLKPMLKRAVNESFNCVSVDGDTSTNDSVFILANGGSGVSVAGKAGLEIFEKNLKEICLSLARQMAADGEGATRTVEITVTGARNDSDAKKVAAAVATSPLVKTAVFGNDANWGRIMAALGRADAEVDPGKVAISFGNLPVVKNGMDSGFSEKRAAKILRSKVVPISINLGLGKGRAKYFTCDFSLEYIKINADYRT